MKNCIFLGSLEVGTHDALSYTLLANCRAQALDLDGLYRRSHLASTARLAAERRAKAEDARDLEAVILEHERNYSEMGKRARAAWERYFTPDAYFAYMDDQACDIMKAQ